MALKEVKKIICTSDKDQHVITQPNLSRTIRQILADTANGQPSPVPLQCSPHDSVVYKDKDLHKLHVCEDKFDAINRQRHYIKTVENRVESNKKKLKQVEKDAKESATRAAMQREYERGRASFQAHEDK